MLPCLGEYQTLVRYSIGGGGAQPRGGALQLQLSPGVSDLSDLEVDTETTSL